MIEVGATYAAHSIARAVDAVNLPLKSNPNPPKTAASQLMILTCSEFEAICIEERAKKYKHTPKISIKAIIMVLFFMVEII